MGSDRLCLVFITKRNKNDQSVYCPFNMLWFVVLVVWSAFYSAVSLFQAESPGFPALEELSVAINPEGVNTGIGIDDNFMFR